MTQADQLFKSLNVQASEVLGELYLSALQAGSDGSAQDKWAEFADALSRSLVLASLIGQWDVVARARAGGASIEIDNEPIEAEQLERYAAAPKLLTIAFVEAVNLFLARVPLLARSVALLAPQARRRAFFVAGIEQRGALGALRRGLAGSLAAGAGGGLTDFLDFASDGPARNLARARIETVYRTNVMTANNDARHAQLNDNSVRSETALWVLDEIQDRRTRGNPSGLYPDAGPHFAMDGFLERPGHAVWSSIWPPNGFNCRASVSPMTWRRAVQRGFATPSRNLIQDAIDRWNGRRWDFLRRGEYPDKGFQSGPASAAA